MGALMDVNRVNILRYLLITTFLFACRTGMITPDDDDAGTDARIGDDAMPPLDAAGEDTGGGGDTPRALYDRDVHPKMLTECAVCHEPGGVARYAFINTPVDDYGVAFSLAGFVNLATPRESRLLAKGAHDGPAWSPEDAADILSWIEGEGADRPVETYIGPNPVRYGFNNNDLGPLGARGSSLNFVVEDYDTGLRLRDVTLVAGPEGLLVELPTIEIYEGGSVTTTEALFADGELRIEPADSLNLGDFVLYDFPSDGQLGVRFQTIRTIRGGVDPGVTCRNVAAFTEYAQPEMNAFCVECHTVRADAVAAMDLTLLNDVLNPDSQQDACDQVLQHMNRARPEDSNLLRNADPTLAEIENHDFTFDDVPQLDAFKNRIFLWLVVEPL